MLIVYHQVAGFECQRVNSVTTFRHAGTSTADRADAGTGEIRFRKNEEFWKLHPITTVTCQEIHFPYGRLVARRELVENNVSFT